MIDPVMDEEDPDLVRLAAASNILALALTDPLFCLTFSRLFRLEEGVEGVGVGGKSREDSITPGDGESIVTTSPENESGE